MTDDAPRPGWPGARPSWEPAPPAAAQPAATTPPAAVPPTPAWPTDASTTADSGPWYRREIDLKLVVAVLIGLVSVTGAVMTWRSAQLGEEATDQDRLALAETVIVRRDTADNELALQDGRELAAAHVAAITAAETLEAQASTLQGQSEEAASAARDEAEELRAVAQGIVDSFNARVALVDYIVADDQGRLTLDERSLRSDLEALSESEAQVQPELTARAANERRDESERYDLWRIPLAAAVVLLTLAQIFRWKPVRLGLTGIATGVWIVASVLAFSGR